MADNKKYYYMRLKENFFDSDEMIILENMDIVSWLGNVLHELDDEYIVEVLGENYSVLKKDVNRVDD